MSWYLDENNELMNADLPEPLDGIFFPPYPANMWYMDNGTLTNYLMAIPTPLGAFACATALNNIILPESLTSIGREAFAESGLRNVTIPNNQCTYYATSFPQDCVVTGGRLIE